jgi:catechol 2,3-dioxygenase-like lactoylglutathione lyase family enzyme
MGAMLDHVSIQCADMAATASFYDAVLAPLGGQRIMDFGEAIGSGLPPSGVTDEAAPPRDEGWGPQPH